METKPVQCPGCGKSVVGAFCNHCGTALTGRAAPRGGNTQIIVPWIAMSVATVALVFSLLSWFDRGGDTVEPELPPFSTNPSISFPGPGQPPDLSSMTPREAADRLFNRVMIASENGNTEEARKFTPMALQAYERAGAQDNDAHYHVALLHMTAGNMKGVRAQIDKLRKSVPNHLFGYMLEHQMAERSKNRESGTRASKAFLSAYDAEMASGRVEYQEHQGVVERFRDQARAGLSGKQ